MQNEFEILRDVASRLEGAGIAYMLTGSMAMNYYAQPRMTRDIDLVVAVLQSEVALLVQIFGADYYVAQQAVESAIAHKSMFNLIHLESLIKVDCIVRKEGDYRLEEFARRQRVRIDDFEAWIVSKEDLIISKLVWAQQSHSEFQLRDVKNLLVTGCNKDYVSHWTRQLGVDNLWQECLHD